jgi:hypothetical protein
MTKHPSKNPQGITRNRILVGAISVLALALMVICGVKGGNTSHHRTTAASKVNVVTAAPILSNEPTNPVLQELPTGELLEGYDLSKPDERQELPPFSQKSQGSLMYPTPK